MAYIVPTNADTIEDQFLYTEARLNQVECLDCLATVGVKKNSEHHTSIQWSGQAVSRCPEFARMSTAPDGRQVHVSCPRLVASIEAATREGKIPIGAEDGY
ncbi:MAG TPA: hypothetical protein VIR30_06815 [Nocardioides sp.]|uniref:Ferredoxin n=1 Tax=Nocardioides daedukensis TaxID=634462 RepID=A0A7Y9UPR5_9ACTN|nr:hypothetical protein [Nocardioides daedukensis]NYG57776.1 hypothetical protein [Nocardioides daedukensis]